MRSRGYVAADAGPFTCCELGAPAVSDPTRKTTVDRRARDDGGERRQTHKIARIRNVDSPTKADLASKMPGRDPKSGGVISKMADLPQIDDPVLN
jgi:hypothetical protein